MHPGWDLRCNRRPAASISELPSLARVRADRREPQSAYVPKGFAHGFQSLADNAEIVYQISEFYAPNSAAGYRYNDVAFGIAWPLPVTAISERDLAWPAFKAGASVLPMT